MEQSLIARKKRKKKTDKLTGYVQSGTLFIGDPIYMGANPQDFEFGVIPEDSTNPFKDFNKFQENLAGKDKNLELPDSYRDNPIGRGCVVQIQQVNGTYEVKKKFDKTTGKLKSITIKIND